MVESKVMSYFMSHYCSCNSCVWIFILTKHANIEIRRGVKQNLKPGRKQTSCININFIENAILTIVIHSYSSSRFQKCSYHKFTSFYHKFSIFIGYCRSYYPLIETAHLSAANLITLYIIIYINKHGIWATVQFDWFL